MAIILICNVLGALLNQQQLLCRFRQCLHRHAHTESLDVRDVAGWPPAHFVRAGRNKRVTSYQFIFTKVKFLPFILWLL